VLMSQRVPRSIALELALTGDAINAEQAVMRERARQFENDRDLVQSILVEGSEEARDVARETLEEVREAIGIRHR